MAAPRDRDYWNHNTAYHPWLVAIAAEHRGDVLDIGCGDGLLAQRLAPVSRSVTGIDPDPAAMGRATNRLASLRHVTVSQGNFQAYQAGARRFDLITFVASLHHMDLRASLVKARDLLTPTGEVAVRPTRLCATGFGRRCACLLRGSGPGCTRRRATSVSSSWIRRRVSTTSAARSTRCYPGASVRRGLYYRYLLRWRTR